MDMTRSVLIERVRAALHNPDEVAGAYDDQPVFPRETLIDHGPDFEHFPGWGGSSVLVLSHENQGVVTWGVELDEDRGRVLVGGDLEEGVGTRVFAPDIETYVGSRRWDRSCLQEPLLQAQADRVQPDDLTALRESWSEGAVTFGWPGVENHRFEQGQVKLMLWSSTGQTDWFISGPVDELKVILSTLRSLSNLKEALWSADTAGESLLG